MDDLCHDEQSTLHKENDHVICRPVVQQFTCLSWARLSDCR